MSTRKAMRSVVLVVTRSQSPGVRGAYLDVSGMQCLTAVLVSSRLGPRHRLPDCSQTFLEAQHNRLLTRQFALATSQCQEPWSPQLFDSSQLVMLG